VTPAAGRSSAALTRPDGTPLRALVVDDEAGLTDLLVSALRYEGWDVRGATDGASAVSIGSQLRPTWSSST